MIERVSTERLREHLGVIVGERHLQTSREHHDGAAAFVGDTLRGSGREVEAQPVRGPFGIGADILSRKRGVGRPDLSSSVDAHCETVIGTPGAEDPVISDIPGREPLLLSFISRA